MGDFNSYSTYTGPLDSEAPATSVPVVRENTGVSRVTVSNGELSESSSKVSSITSTDLSPYDEGDWKRSAQTSTGRTATEITPDTIVTLNGTQAKVRDFVAAGLLQKTSEGFELAANAGVEDAPQDNATAPSDAAVMPSEIATAVDDALAQFDNSTLDSGLALGIASVTGETDFSSVVRTVAQRSGMDPAEVKQRLEFTQSAYQAMADHYITKNGIDKADLENFYEFAKGNRGELRGTLEKMMWGQDLSGFKGMISKYQSAHAPSLQALKDAGFPTRTLGEEPEVRIQNVWMGLKAAARANLI